MPHRLYSARLIELHGGGSQTYNVPAGIRVVTRFVTGFNANALAGATFNLSITPADVTFCQIDLGPQEWQGHELRVCVDYPGHILCSADSGVDVTLYGYELTLP